jgi:ATP phosphoribosyltransferase regulatory subunit
VRDFLPRAARRRRAIATRLLDTFESWGYQRIITPLFERADVLERGLGDDARSAAIRFIEPASGEVVALRPDITPQIARIAATRMADLGGPVRLCYEGAVARIANGARGQREVLQSGVELLDAGGPMADAELLALAAAALSTSEVGEQSLDLGHVALTRLAIDGIDDAQRRERLAVCLRRKDRLGVARAAQGLPARQRKLLEALPTLFGEPDKTLRAARQLSLPAIAKRALDELEQTVALARDMSVAGGALLDELTLDLGELRGFEYYTGMRVSAFIAGAGGPVLRGGRYDRLVERYGRKACATGFAVDIEAMAQAESEAETGPETMSAGVLLVADAEHRELANRLATVLRSAGMRVALDLGRRQSDKSLTAYAARVELPIVLRLGSDEFQILREREPAQRVSRATVRRASRSDASALIQSLVEKTK